MAKNTNDLQSDLERSVEQINHFMEVTLPQKAAEKLNDHIQDNFNQERNSDTGKKWAPRKEKKSRKRKRGKPESELPRSKRRGILIGNGTMRGSIDVEGERTGVQEATIQVSSDVIYMTVHNEGLRAGRGKGFQMPQRQMGPIPGQPLPKAVEEDIEDFIDEHMDQFLNLNF